MSHSSRSRRVYKLKRNAIRHVPEILREWGEQLGDECYAAFEEAESEWGVTLNLPNGEPHFLGQGYGRKTDEQIATFDLSLIAGVACRYSPDLAECKRELAFNLKALSDELYKAALLLESDESDSDDEDDDE